MIMNELVSEWEHARICNSGSIYSFYNIEMAIFESLFNQFCAPFIWDICPFFQRKLFLVYTASELTIKISCRKHIYLNFNYNRLWFSGHKEIIKLTDFTICSCKRMQWNSTQAQIRDPYEFVELKGKR